ncbi:MAG: hypothetical protein MUC38_07510 [Cyclobacteriaceae bacterium]|nr:hypothetical protein [Cyclobacteriaceae bacterium]
MAIKRTGWFVLLAFLAGCATVRDSPKYQLADGEYFFHQRGQKAQKVYVHIDEETDTITVRYLKGGSPMIKKSTDEFFTQRSFDLDVLVAPFKYRATQVPLPPQLNTSFNGNLFLGYRWDRFKLRFRNTPAGLQKKLVHRAFSLGGFGGIGSSPINPWTTNNAITEEYDGFVLSKGMAALVGINNLTVGVALGFDHLTGRDRPVWIYENDPWVGLVVGLNLN